MKTVKKCPKCKSLNITLWLGAITGQYHCKNCGYVGVLIVEEDVED